MRNLEISTGLFAVRVEQLDTSYYASLLIWIAEKEIEIVYDLAQRVLEYEDMLVEASDICGELDRYSI